MNLSCKIKIITLFVVLSFNSFANSNLVLQHAGELGRVAIGLGKTYSFYNIELIYGYHPEINTYAIRNSFSLVKKNKVKLNIGLTFYQVDGFSNNDIPNDYYEQSVNKRAYLFYSISFREKESEFFYENGINDVNMEAYYNNDINIDNLMSIGFGYRHYF